MALPTLEEQFELITDGNGNMSGQDLALVLGKLDPGKWDETAVGTLLQTLGCRGKEDFISLTSFLRAIDSASETSTLAPPAAPGGLVQLPSEAPRGITPEPSGSRDYLQQHSIAWPSEVDLRYIQEHAVMQKMRAFVQRLLYMKPYDIDRFGVDYFSGALASQKRLVLICSDVEEADVLRAAVRPLGQGSEIVTADWDFQSVPSALSAVVADCQREHGTFKTVAMCCHGSTQLMGFATGGELEAALQAKWKELGEPDLAGGVPDMETPMEALRLERGCAGEAKSGKWLLTATHGIDMDTGLADDGVEEAILDTARAASVRLDILACRLAGTQVCKSLISNWEQKSKTNIAASSDVTGNAEVGGNWVLETDGINVARTYFDEDKLSKWCGCLARGTGRGLALSETQKENVAHGLFELLDRNGTGVLEEFEWVQGCRWARKCLKAKPNAALAATIFGQFDEEEGTGAVQVEKVLEKLPAALRALGVLGDQALEALHLLQEQRAREGDGDASILDLTLPEEGDGEEEEEQEPDSEKQEQTQWRPPLPRSDRHERDLAQAVARRCSARRGQVLRQFLEMLEGAAPTEPASQEAEKPLAVRAKRAAWKAVASADPLPPPPESLDLSFDLDSLYAGGENLWVSAEVGVAKSSSEDDDPRAQETEEAAEELQQQLPAQRAPADLLVVVDISGSMNSVLPSVRKCLSSLTSLVEAQDRLALVKFDDRAECVLPWTAMDAEGREAFKAVQRDLVARGGTCFLPVLKLCLEELLQDEVPGRARSLLFISDGCPNESDQDILNLVCGSCLANLTIVTAGFGPHVKADLLGTVAQAGCGPFVYIHNEQSIPVQLGRIWAAVAYTSICTSFMIVRPLAGSHITAVEGAFGTAELCLRPDGHKSEQQVMLVQLGPVRHGAAREVAFRLKLPPALQKRPLADKQLRSPLLEVSLVMETVAVGDEAGPPVFMRKLEFLPLQVPSLLAENLIPFPVRFVLENELDESFDVDTCLKQVAQVLGVEESELELNRILAGSIIVDFNLKLKPEQAAGVMKAVRSPRLQKKMSAEFEKMGYQMKSVTAPGQQVFQRLLQVRFAGALSAAADKVTKEPRTESVPELHAVKKLAVSELANCLDPPGQGSMAAAVKQDCDTVLVGIAETASSNGRERQRMHHEMLQLRAAHVAQYKCEAEAASIETYETKEAAVASERMECACAGVSATLSFLESTRESSEMRTHPGPDGRLGVFLLLRPRPGAEEDFSYLAHELCPTFKVKLTAQDGASEPRAACAYPVHAAHMMPICIASNHPTTLEDRAGGKVSVPFARRIKVSVDRRSCYGGSLSFYVDCTSQKAFKVIDRTTAAGPPGEETFSISGGDLWYSYSHAKGATFEQIAETWGFEFRVQVADDGTESGVRGVLLQARFPGQAPGAYDIVAELSPQVWEVPSHTVSTCELPSEELPVMISSGDQHLQLGRSAVASHGLRHPARMVGVNGSGARSKECLRELAQAVPSTDTLQVTILTSEECKEQPIQKLEREKLAKVPEDMQQRFTGSMTAHL